MKNDTSKSKRILSSLPAAAAGAILSSSMAAVLTEILLPEEYVTIYTAATMTICALVSILLEILPLPKAVRILIPALSTAAGAVSLLVPHADSGINLLATLVAEGITDARAVFLPCVCSCILLCSAVSVINRHFVLRCITASGELVAIVVGIFLKMTVRPIVLTLLFAYILIVVCQAFAPKNEPGKVKSTSSWYVLLCIATAVIAMSIQAPETRIPWEKLIRVNGSEQMEELTEALQIDPLNDPEVANTSGVDGDLSTMGGLIETNIGEPFVVSFSDGAYADRLNAGIYNCYNGRGWECTVSMSDTGYFDSVQPEDLTDSDFGRVYVKKTSPHSNTILTPPYTVTVSSTDCVGIVRNGGKLVFREAVTEPYTVYFADSMADFEMTDAEREAYLSLPESIPERVAEFAQEATYGAKSDGEKADALVAALSQFTYNKRVTSVPEGEDFVDYFIFTAHEGYCEYFASAMAVLARYENIPSRLVAGYLLPPQGYYPAIIVTNADAHAWVELYIEGRGWVVYDPTPAGTPTNAVQGAEDDDSEAVKRNLKVLRDTLLYAYAVIAGMVVLFFVFRPFVRRGISRIQLDKKHRGKAGYRILLRCL